MLAIFILINGSSLKVASCTGIEQTIDHPLVHAEQDESKVKKKKETNQSV